MIAILKARCMLNSPALGGAFPNGPRTALFIVEGGGRIELVNLPADNAFKTGKTYEVSVSEQTD